jgi:hypothetical protein
MNERIKQLLLESGFKIFGDKIVAGDFGSSGNATLCSQKFAELIVKDVFAMIKESCVDAAVMDRVDEVIDDRLGDAAGEIADAYEIDNRIY